MMQWLSALFKFPSAYIYPRGKAQFLKDLETYGYHNRKTLVFWWHQLDHAIGAIPYGLLSLLLTGSPFGVTVGAVMKEAMDLSRQKNKDYFKSLIDVTGWSAGAAVLLLF